MKKLLLTVLGLLGVAVLGLLVVYVFFFRLASIASHDMQPALGKDATVVVSLRGEPERGDLILFEVQGAPMIRRIIGMPGERVRLDEFVVHIDDDEATYADEYRVDVSGRDMAVREESIRGARHLVIDDPKRRRVNAHAVDTGSGYFVMADFREYGTDSYDFGVVEPAQVRGVVVSVLSDGEPLAPPSDD